MISLRRTRTVKRGRFRESVRRGWNEKKTFRAEEDPVMFLRASRVSLRRYVLCPLGIISRGDDPKGARVSLRDYGGRFVE